MTTKTVESHFSLVLETPAAEPVEANRYFLAKLEVETDPADVKNDLQRGRTDFIVMDVRSEQHFTKCRIPGVNQFTAPENQRRNYGRLIEK